MYFLNRKERYGSHELDMHWYYPLTVSDEGVRGNVEPQIEALDRSLRPIADTWKLLKDYLGGSVRLYECTISANAFGTEGRVHADLAAGDRRRGHVAALIYTSPRWDKDWAGELVVFDREGEIRAAVIPRPGRVVLLENDPVHVGRSVSRICPAERRVLVFKLWRPK